MYLEELTINGFRCFGNEFKIKLNPNLNVLIGENGAGKTCIISAVRQLFNDSESGYYSISDKDFYKAIDNSTISESFSITANFSGLNEQEKVTYLSWYTENENIELGIVVENKERYGRYSKQIWGGINKQKVVDTELYDLAYCIYLPPLRDAESKLQDGRQSRLSRLMKALCRKQLKTCSEQGNEHPLVTRVKEFNSEISQEEEFSILDANRRISESLKNAIGESFSQATQIHFSEVNFSRIVEGLRLVFFPSHDADDASVFRSLEENSLGYNNLLYIASILAELVLDDGDEIYKILLIEEPEAHLHPQLQIRLLQYLSEVAKNKNIQVVVTTHSTVLSSSISYKSLIHISRGEDVIATPLIECNITKDSSEFIDRWLDVTKSNLFFSRGIILVEGIAEAILIPVLAKRYFIELGLGSKSLDDYGISVINQNGIYFRHFIQFFCNINASLESIIYDERDQSSDVIESVDSCYEVENKDLLIETDVAIGRNVPIKCAGITDNDPPKDAKPHAHNLIVGKNHALKLMKEINKSDCARLYASPYKTLEYDFAIEGENLNIMASILYSKWPTEGRYKSKLLSIKEKDWKNETESNKADASTIILHCIEANYIGKGWFAQMLAEKIQDPALVISIPEYIKNAIDWVRP